MRLVQQQQSKRNEGTKDYNAKFIGMRAEGRVLAGNGSSG